MYLSGEGNIGVIAKLLGCSRQYLYKIAKDHDWAARKSKIHTAALLESTAIAPAVEVALVELRAKVACRLLELDELCTKKNLRAILAWLQMAGVNGKMPEETGPRKVEVTNDFSDQRHVTIVNPGQEPPDEALAPIEPGAESGDG